MKRKVMLFGIFFILAVLLSLNVSAELNDTQISKAYSCLESKAQNCSTSLDDNIFTLLSLKTCRDNVMQASSSDECWPSGSCNVKQTSQALLALKEAGSSGTEKPKTWLLSHRRTPTNIIWFLQIESAEAAECSVKYDGIVHPFSISDEKKLSGNAGGCLSPDYDNYWFKISPTSQCQDNEYEISCNKGFSTSKLFKEQSLDTIYVSAEEVDSVSGGGTTTEQINSSCFADSNSCSYEGSLWASITLKLMGEDISPYIPYLVTMADSNPKTLPEAFLTILLGDDYKTDLLLKQKSNQYWETSNDKYYDTAAALLALRSDDSTEKANSLDWLQETQGTDGCWQGGSSVKNTAFLLYSISPREAPSGGNGSTSKPSCEPNNGYCMSLSSSCAAAGGSVLDTYQCSFGVCCSTQKELKTCDELGGEICSSGETCSGGRTTESFDSRFSCCVQGSCVPTDDEKEESECELDFGQCRSSCIDGEKADSSLSCDSPSDICCIEKSSTSYLWVWILVVLIILVGLAIIFRNKLREFWFRISSSFRPSGPSSGSSIHHQPSFNPMRRMIPRRILPHSGPVHRGPTPARRPSGELDDVLKKLKDMSK